MRRETRNGRAGRGRKSAAFACVLALSFLTAAASAERLSKDAWQVLAVAYPDDREVSVVLGGAERTLTSRGLAKVRWRDGTATLQIEIERLSTPAEAGWTDRQYVLWAVDSEKRVYNLGVVPLNNQSAKWSVQVPSRVFGLLVTAERSAQASAPGEAVALESLLPTNPTLVVPVFRVGVTLAAPAG